MVFRRQYFVRFYLLVKVSNFARDKGYRILLVLSDPMLFIIEKILST